MRVKPLRLNWLSGNQQQIDKMLRGTCSKSGIRERGISDFTVPFHYILELSH